MADTCRHCGGPRGTRPRGLCWSCYTTPGLRDQYPSTSRFARSGVGGNITGGHDLPADVTRARPGTEAKLCVLESRAYRGVALFHPADAPLDLT